MSYPSPPANPGLRNSAFGACMAATLGVALLETACILLAARPAVHLGATLAGAVLVAVTARRFLRHWPARQAMHTRHAPAPLRRIVPAAFVGAAAYLAAAALSRGVVSPFVLFALSLVLLPWATFTETRVQCLGYAAGAGAGIAAGLLGSAPRFNPMLLLAVAWMLWLSAILGWMRVALDEKMAARRAASW